MSITYTDIKKLCQFCNNEFIVRILEYPSNCDDRRESYITCPYCNKVVENIHLDKNQDIMEFKIKNYGDK